MMDTPMPLADAAAVAEQMWNAVKVFERMKDVLHTALGMEADVESSTRALARIKGEIEKAAAERDRIVDEARAHEANAAIELEAERNKWSGQLDEMRAAVDRQSALAADWQNRVMALQTTYAEKLSAYQVEERAAQDRIAALREELQAMAARFAAVVK